MWGLYGAKAGSPVYNRPRENVENSDRQTASAVCHYQCKQTVSVGQRTDGDVFFNNTMFSSDSFFFSVTFNVSMSTATCEPSSVME